MAQQNQRLSIQSKDDRARASQEPADGLETSAGGTGDDRLTEVRQLAQSMGYEIRRTPRSRRARPETREGRVSTTCRLHPEVRAVMEQARLELNLNYSDMVNAGIIMFLESQNLRVDVDPKQFLPSP